MVGLFALQWLMGMLVYLNPCCPPRIRSALMVPHIACGVASTAFTLLAVLTGPMALVGR